VGVQVAKSGQARKPSRFDNNGVVRGKSPSDSSDDTALDKDVQLSILSDVDHVRPVYQE
jgi:hypothetical protein